MTVTHQRPLTFSQTTPPQAEQGAIGTILEDAIHELLDGLVQEFIEAMANGLKLLSLASSFGVLAYLSKIEATINTIDPATEKAKCELFIEDFLQNQLIANTDDTEQAPLGLSLAESFDILKANTVWEANKDFLKSLAHLAAAEDYSEHVMQSIASDNQVQMNSVLKQLSEVNSTAQATTAAAADDNKFFNSEDQANNIVVLRAFFKELESHKLEAIPEASSEGSSPSPSNSSLQMRM